MGQLLIVLAVVALAAARQEGSSCGCGCMGGCSKAGSCCPSGPPNTIDCLPREK